MREQRPAFLMTWNADHGQPKSLSKMLRRFRRGVGAIVEHWRINAHTKAKIGDQVFFLKQGTKPRAIFGYGRIASLPWKIGPRSYNVKVRIETLCDPDIEPMLVEEDFAGILTESQINAQRSGNSLDTRVAQKLNDKIVGRNNLLSKKDAHMPDVIATPFDLRHVKDERRRIQAKITARRGQGRFRNVLLKAHGGRCAITAFDVHEALDAAHIFPYLGDATNHASNGILLRSDIHNLFDEFLISIHPGTRRVVVAAALEMTCYGALAGKKVERASALSQSALENHFKAYRSQQAAGFRKVRLDASGGAARPRKR